MNADVYDPADYFVVLLDGARGIYIPQDFIRLHPAWRQSVSMKDHETLLRGPDDPEYWEAWEDVYDTAYLVDDEGVRWTLYQDKDLFAVREDTPDEVWEMMAG